LSKKSLDEAQEKITLDDSVIGDRDSPRSGLGKRRDTEQDRDTPGSGLGKRRDTEDSVIEKKELTSPENTKLTSPEKKDF
jgi:hypothetical protein